MSSSSTDVATLCKRFSGATEAAPLVSPEGWTLLRPGTKKAHVWTRFSAVRYAPEHRTRGFLAKHKIAAVRCDTCFQGLSFNNNTSSLRQHVLSKHPENYDVMVAEEKALLDATAVAQPGVDGHIATTRPQWSNHKHATVNKLFVKWVVDKCLPLTTLCEDSFREAINLATGGAYNGCVPSTLHIVRNNLFSLMTLTCACTLPPLVSPQATRSC
jgi:hypothetical protein